MLITPTYAKTNSVKINTKITNIIKNK